MSMNMLKLGRVACTAGLAVACAAGLTGCGSSGAAGTAATVNGTAISEDTVTAYVENFRASSSLQDEAAWAQWLVDNDRTPQSVREEVVDYYVDQELLKQAAEERGVTVDEAAVDAAVQSVKDGYGSDEAWQEALQKANTTEEAYCQQTELTLLETALRDSFNADGDDNADQATVADEDLLEHASSYNGAKHFSLIVIAPDGDSDAQDVLDRINDGLDFAEAAAQYSADESAQNGGDKGWDVLSAPDAECAAALEGLEEGQVSEPIETENGVCIVKCTEVFSVPEDGLTATDQVPEALLDAARAQLASPDQSNGYNDWYADFKGKAEIVVNDMPEQVSYNVDLSQYQ